MNKKQSKGRKNKGGGKKSRPVPVGPIGTVVVPRSPGMAALPVALRTKLRYFYSYTVTTGGALSYSEYTFRSNSLYDPDFTSVGAQPAGFAALATLYGKYRVLSADVSLTAVNDAGGSTSVVFYQKDATTPYSSIINAAQQGFTKVVMLSDQSGGRNQHTFRVRIRPWIVLGVTKERYMNDDQFSAAVTASPAIAAYFGAGLSAITVSASAQFQVSVVYDAVLFDRVNLA